MLFGERQNSSEYQVRSGILTVANDLAQTMDYESISIQAICNEAHISRQTFYRYFSNKMEIALWWLNVMLEDYFYQLSNVCGWSETLRMLLENDNRCIYLYQKIALSTDRALYTEKSSELVCNFFVNELTARDIEITNEISFQIDICAHATCYILNRWYATGMEISAEELVGIFDNGMPPVLRQLLELPVKPGSKQPF